MNRIWLVMFALLLATPVLAITDPWDGAYEVIPADTDLVSGGDDAIRSLKSSIRERMEVQHEWAAGAGETYMGFHREGSAWVLDSADCSGEGIDADQEVGRLCRENTDQSLWVADVGGGNWVQVTPSQSNVNSVLGNTFDGYVPTNAIILWDAIGGNGDEDCDGLTTAGECPCGYEVADEFEGLTIRGADITPSEANIPDLEGESCIEPGAMGTCTAQAGMYDDTLTEVQMPAHTHDMGQEAVSAGGVVVADTAPGGLLTESTGDDGPHYHPFRTVLFCRKN